MPPWKKTESFSFAYSLRERFQRRFDFRIRGRTRIKLRRFADESLRAERHDGAGARTRACSLEIHHPFAFCRPTVADGEHARLRRGHHLERQRLPRPFYQSLGAGGDLRLGGFGTAVGTKNKCRRFEVEITSRHRTADVETESLRESQRARGAGQ